MTVSKMSREEFEAVAAAKAGASWGARRREIDRRIAEHGLRVEPFGVGHRIVGQGVDLLVGDWRVLTLADLEPVRVGASLLGNRYR